MPFSYVIDGSKQLATGTFSGSVDGVAIASGIRSVYEDLEWRPGFDTLWECTGITELLLGPNDLTGLVALHGEFGPRAGNGWEIIVVARALDHAMAKIYSMMMRNQARRVRVCRSVAEAEALLGQRP